MKFLILLILPIFAFAKDITIQWDAAPNAASYKVLKGQGDEGGRVYNYNAFPIAEVGASETSYTITGIEPGVHYFTVVSCSAEGACSPLSAEQRHEIIPQNNIPDTPTGVEVR